MKSGTQGSTTFFTTYWVCTLNSGKYIFLSSSWYKKRDILALGQDIIITKYFMEKGMDLRFLLLVPTRKLQRSFFFIAVLFLESGVKRLRLDHHWSHRRRHRQPKILWLGAHEKWSELNGVVRNEIFLGWMKKAIWIWHRLKNKDNFAYN